MANLCAYGGKGDNGAGSSLFHMGQDALAAQEHGFEIQIHGAVPILFRYIFGPVAAHALLQVDVLPGLLIASHVGGGRAASAGSRHKNIYPAQFLDDICRGSLDILPNR